jgi:hypothetical protein
MIPWLLLSPFPGQFEPMKSTVTKVVAKQSVPIKTLEVTRTDGPGAKVGDLVTVVYRLEAAGKILADSEEFGVPFTYRLGDGTAPSFIDLAVNGVQLLGSRRAAVPSTAIRERQGLPPIIPPDTEIIVTVRVVSLSVASAAQGE